MDTPEKIQALSTQGFDPNAIHAERLLEPWVDHTNSNRGQMFSSHINQFISISGAQPPLVSTGFEGQVFENSSLGYKKVTDPIRVIAKVQKNKYNYALIVQNTETDEYDIIYRQEGINLTEHFGLEYDNTVIDSLETGDVVSDEILYHDGNYDTTPDYNSQYGRNLNAVFLSYFGYTNEDACVISESASKKLGSTYVKKVSVKLNTNDIPLNLFGDDSEYKSYPVLGEKFNRDSPFFAFRKLNYREISNIQDKALTKLRKDDQKFISEGKIIDIDVYCNYDTDLLKSEAYYSQIYNDYMLERNYYRELLDVMKPIITDPMSKVTSGFTSEYNKIYHFYDTDHIKLTADKVKFDKILIEFTVMYHDKAIIGSKVTNRFGGKNVISKVIPDDQMPTIETINGEDFNSDTHIPKHADIILSPAGVMNRENMSQNFEQELNFIAQHIRYRIEQDDSLSLDDKYALVKEFAYDVNNLSGQAIEFIWSQCETDADKAEVVQQWIDEGIYLQQDVFTDNLNIDGFARLYKKYGINHKYSIGGIKTPLIMGEIYYMRLHHLPTDKLSARSTSTYNYYNLPSKSSAMKSSTDYVSSTPLRLGEMETVNSSLIGSIDPIINLIDMYGTNTEARRKLSLNLLTTNPFNPDLDLNVESIGNNNKILNSLLYSIGIKMHLKEEQPATDEHAKVFSMSDTDLDTYLDKLIEDNPSQHSLGNADYMQNTYTIRNEETGEVSIKNTNMIPEERPTADSDLTDLFTE